MKFDRKFSSVPHDTGAVCAVCGGAIKMGVPLNGPQNACSVPLWLHEVLPQPYHSAELKHGG